MTSPQTADNVPLWTPRRKKGKKRKNTYTGPPQDDDPGSRIHFDPVTKEPTNVTFYPGTLCLPILLAAPDVNLDDQGFPNRQRNCNFLIEKSDGVNLI